MKKFMILLLLAMTMLISCYDDTTTTTKTSSIITIPETPTQTEDLNMLKAIKESPNYFFKDNKQLFSVDEDGVNQILITTNDLESLELTDFFRKSDESFFTIKTIEEIDNPDYDELCDIEDPETEFCEPMIITQEKLLYYKQVEGVVTKIDTLPLCPAIERTVFDNHPVFEIHENSHEGTPVSDVSNLTTGETGSHARFFLVNGAVAYVHNTGLFFHVADGLYEGDIIVRENGLYFWASNSTKPYKIDGTGQLW